MILGVVVFLSGTVRAAALMERVEHAQWEGDVATLEATWRELGVRSEVDGVGARRVRFQWAFVAWRINHALYGTSDSDANRKHWLETARSDLDWLLDRKADDVGVLVVHSAVMGELAAHGGWFSRIRLGTIAKSSTDRAYELDPENPRVALQRGIIHFHTPSFAGGGAQRAIVELERAIVLYDAGVEPEPWPSWGRLDAYAWLGQALAEAGRVDEARAVFDRALAFAPSSGWVRSVLLPALGP